MTPYLTGRGRWLFATGIVFVFVGAVVRQPLLVIFGQLPFMVLLVSLVLLMPAARSLDRRSTEILVDGSDGDDDVVRLSRDGERKVSLWMENRSKSPVRVARLRPYPLGDIDVEVLEGGFRVDRGEGREFDVLVSSEGIGRASLQGFDVEISDRFGLLAARDYLPALQLFETAPSIARRRHRRDAASARAGGAELVDRSTRSGFDVRELRDYQPGDPLRTVAWKATVRQRRLITREFEDEQSDVEYLAVDISSSMRAGRPRGAKLEHAIEIAAGIAGARLDDGRPVGLWTFDTGIYGGIDAGTGRRQRRRIRQHLTGLKSVVCRRRTALDDEELTESLADYLLVQERLDFRRGRGLEGEVDDRLLRRWLRSVMDRESGRWNGGADVCGVVGEEVDSLRRFFRLRGIPLDPAPEVNSQAKVRGLESVFEQLVRSQIGGGRLTVVSDLCGLKDIDRLERSISAVRRRGTKIRILAPFTPLYAQREWPQQSRADLIRDIFGWAERNDRLEIARRLASMGISVRFIGPDDVGPPATADQ